MKNPNIHSKSILKIILLVLLAIIGGLAVYNHFGPRIYYPFITTPSGLNYKIARYSNKRQPKEGDALQLQIVHYSKNKKGKTKEIVNFKKDNINRTILFNPLFKEKDGSIGEAVGLLHEGGKIICKFTPADYCKKMWGDEKAASNFNEDDTIFVMLKLEKIMTEAALKESIMKKNEEQLTKDVAAIDNYLQENNIAAQSTPSGLRYIIDQESRGVQTQKGDTVKVHYTGRLLNGKVFDTSLITVAKESGCFIPQRNYVPLELVLGMGSVIAGWDEGILLLKKGEKGRFFIPSTLAYGEQGSNHIIPSNAVLVFEVEVADILKK